MPEFAPHTRLRGVIRQVRAQLQINHDTFGPSEVASALANTFGVFHDPTVLRSSATFSADHAKWQQLVAFATESPDYRLICYTVMNTQLQAVVEPTHGSLPTGCQAAWDGIRGSLKKKKPRLEVARLIDSMTNRELFHGSDGFTSHASTLEVLSLVSITVLTIVYLVVAAATFAKDEVDTLLLGAIPALLSGLVALVVAWRLHRKGKIRWSSK